MATLKGEIIGRTQDGYEVYVRMDDDASHIHCAMFTLREGISKIRLEGKTFETYQVPFDYVIGKDRCVPVGTTDKVVLWKRPGRKGKTPMVLNKRGEDTRQLNVVISYDEEMKHHVVLTAFLGRFTPQEPWDPDVRDREASEKFWASHAIVPTIAEMVALMRMGLA